MNILVSHCLLGAPCRYDGQSIPAPELERLREAGHTLVPVCPEVLGGMSTPRVPAEVQKDGQVMDRPGKNVTLAYLSGAHQALAIARQHNCTMAILKAKSPSCGSRKIYDGTFTGTLIPEQGVTARLLKQAGITILDESELDVFFSTN